VGDNIAELSDQIQRRSHDLGFSRPAISFEKQVRKARIWLPGPARFSRKDSATRRRTNALARNCVDLSLQPADLNLTEACREAATDIARRRSVRAHGTHPLTLSQLGEFLHALRGSPNLLSTEPLPRRASATHLAPYPSGGASYEFEIYLIVRSCEVLSADSIIMSRTNIDL